MNTVDIVKLVRRVARETAIAAHERLAASPSPLNRTSRLSARRVLKAAYGEPWASARDRLQAALTGDDLVYALDGLARLRAGREWPIRQRGNRQSA